MLGRALWDYPHALRSDFQHYYGLNLDGLGIEYSYHHAAVLVANLPLDSRTYKAMEPALSWDRKERLLANVANLLAILVWQNTADGRKGINKPKLIVPEGCEQQQTGEGFMMPLDELEEFLTRPAKTE